MNKLHQNFESWGKIERNLLWEVGGEGARVIKINQNVKLNTKTRQMTGTSLLGADPDP